MINEGEKNGNLFGNPSLSGEKERLCGIDEAGRGPLAGPLVMAGVILTGRIYKLRDSKRLTPREREKLYEHILQRSRHHLVVIDADALDRDGLSLSLRKGLQAILEALGGAGVRFLFDGNSDYGVPGVATLVKADDKVREVSAASILAKVTRDRLMLEYARQWPQYGFDRHKGYGTREHLEAIERHGLCPIHRRTFRPRRLREAPGLFDD